MHNRLKQALSVTLTLLIIAAPAVAWSQRQNIFDWWRLRQYQASSEIQAIADHTTMTDYGRKLFYVYHTSLEDKDSFNDHCRNAEQTIVLGCYVSREGIYLYNVTEPRLAGVKEVTAAHEVLHAGYERLSSKERASIDAQLDTVFKKITNERLKKTVEAYRSKDASVVPNELHSIIGTEVRQLTPELESYYKRYFSNRLAVVEFSEKYEQAFTEREKKVEEYDKQLEQMRNQIAANEATIDKQRASLEAQRAALEAQLAAKRYQEYNAAVPAYNASVRSYNATVVATQRLIDDYNQLVAARNALASEENDLIKAIDSRPTTIEQQ